MDAKARWEQEQVNQLEAFTVLEQLPILPHKTE